MRTFLIRVITHKNMSCLVGGSPIIIYYNINYSVIVINVVLPGPSKGIIWDGIGSLLNSGMIYISLT